MRPSAVLASKRPQVLALLTHHGATHARVFGSIAKGADREGSDIDLLVELPAGTSLLKLVALQQALSDTLGVAVDLCTEQELHPELKPHILAEARAL